LRDFIDAGEVSDCFNILSRWSDDPACTVAGIRLAERIATDAGLLNSLNGAGVAYCLYAPASR
jgi:hypothetical protein